jgi:26S proteasome regulatory subunit N12
MTSELRSLLSELHTSLQRRNLDTAAGLLTRAKRTLLQQNALIPTPSTPSPLLSLAREILELGALTSIRRADAPAFTRYYQQLQPFYDAEGHIAMTGSGAGLDLKTSQRSKITGLYLLLLLSVGNTSQFHTVLEGLVVEASLKGHNVEDDPYIKYPVELERSLMEGSYDKVWRETKSERVPSEDFGLFSNVCSAHFAFFFSLFTVHNSLTGCYRRSGPGWYNPKRNCRLFGEGISVHPHFQCQKPPLPGLRRRRCRVRTRTWLDPS